MTRHSVSAVVLAYRRSRELGIVLDRLAELPVDEVLVADGAGEAAPVVAQHGERTRLIEPEQGGDVGKRPRVLVAEFLPNWGIAGLNAAARLAIGDFLLFLDDDSYPLPGSIEAMLAAFEDEPQLGVVGGLVREIDAAGRTLSEREPGTFDWWLRGGARGQFRSGGSASFFFPQGACLIRREAFSAVGGFFEPFFKTGVELELATRMLAHGWEVAYLPGAPFHHLRDIAQAEGGRLEADAGLPGLSKVRFRLRLRVRNQLWYFVLHFPGGLAARRIPAYLAFDLVECLYRRTPGAWLAGIRDAWAERAQIRGARNPLPREVIRRAELNRGRMHLRLLAATPGTRLRGLFAKSARY